MYRLDGYRKTSYLEEMLENQKAYNSWKNSYEEDTNLVVYPEIGELYRDRQTNDIFFVDEELSVYGQHENVFVLRNIAGDDIKYAALVYFKNDNLTKVETREFLKSYKGE